MKKRMLFLGLIVGMVVGLFACVAEDDDEDETVVPWTWERLARTIDDQMGEISTDTNNPTCDVYGSTVGAHCKNQLRGKVTQQMVAMMVAVNNDCSWPSYVYKDWRPLNEDLCTFSGDGDSIADIYQVCSVYGSTSSAGQVQCEKTGENRYKLEYLDCKYEDPSISCWYNLNGKIAVNSYFTKQGELITEIKYNGFKAERISGSLRSLYQFNGYEVLYKVLDPITGDTVTGSTGKPNKMRILKETWTVDRDGPSNPEVEGTYKVRLADDAEDGIILYNPYGNAVWYDEDAENPSATAIEMTFYDKEHPWNYGHGQGCRVDAVNVDKTSRTFDIVSESAYGNGCLPDKTGISY